MDIRVIILNKQEFIDELNLTFKFSPKVEEYLDEMVKTVKSKIMSYLWYYKSLKDLHKIKVEMSYGTFYFKVVDSFKTPVGYDVRFKVYKES